MSEEEEYEVPTVPPAPPRASADVIETITSLDPYQYQVNRKYVWVKGDDGKLRIEEVPETVLVGGGIKEDEKVKRGPLVSKQAALGTLFPNQMRGAEYTNSLVEEMSVDQTPEKEFTKQTHIDQLTSSFGVSILVSNSNAQKNLKDTLQTTVSQISQEYGEKKRSWFKR